MDQRLKALKELGEMLESRIPRIQREEKKLLQEGAYLTGITDYHYSILVTLLNRYNKSCPSYDQLTPPGSVGSQLYHSVTYKNNSIVVTRTDLVDVRNEYKSFIDFLERLKNTLEETKRKKKTKYLFND